MISPQSLSRDQLFRCLAEPAVLRVQPVHLTLTPWRNPENGRTRSIQVLGFDPTYPILKDPELADHADQLKQLGAVLFDRLSRPEFGPVEALRARAGRLETEVNRKHVDVVGFYSMGASFAADGGILTSEQTFRKITPEVKRDEIEFGLIFLKPGADPTQVRLNLQKLLGDPVSVLTRRELELREENYWRDSTGIGFIFNLGVGMGFMVGVVIVYQILHGDIADHLPQYATLKAMGYSNGFLLTMLAQESLLLALLGYGPGILLSLGLYHQASAATSLPIFMTPERAAGVLGATVVMCLLSAAIASRKLLAADPAEIF